MRPSAAERNKVREEQIRIRPHVRRNGAIRMHAGERGELEQQISIRIVRHAVQVEPGKEEDLFSAPRIPGLCCVLGFAETFPNQKSVFPDNLLHIHLKCWWENETARRLRSKHVFCKIGVFLLALCFHVLKSESFC
jgi:hypothetical protein